LGGDLAAKNSFVGEAAEDDEEARRLVTAKAFCEVKNKPSAETNILKETTNNQNFLRNPKVSGN
jgi:hypothetical protein